MKKESKNSWFIEALQLLFIALKLMGYIDWNWIWVLCPFWGTIAIALVVGLIGYAESKIKNPEKS